MFPPEPAPLPPGAVRLLSVPERRAVLDARIAALTADGFKVLKRTDGTVVVAKLNAAGCLLGLFGGVATRAITGGTFGSTPVEPANMLYIAVDDYGRLTESTEKPAGWR